LPDDLRSLAEWAAGLYDWGRGFLFGLGLAGLDARRFSGPAREVCDDFVAITQLDLQELDDSEANEQALTELTEFIRVATMLVYEEQARAPEAGVAFGDTRHGPGVTKPKDGPLRHPPEADQ